MKNFNCINPTEHLPIPVCEDCPEYIDFYFKTWELVAAHVKNIDGMPQSPYMDEGFCDTQIWIWDTCFMAQFCKYASDTFPGIESLNNFYEVLYGTKSLPKIIPSPNEPSWTGAIPNTENDIVIHIADNPPLFAWCEYEYALLSGDLDHIKELLYDNQFLQKHYTFLESLKEPRRLRGVHCKTQLISEDIGYRWEGGCSGMDNTPRGRLKARDGKQRPNNPNMLWLDAICQQALSAKTIAKLFTLCHDSENAAVWNKRFEEKKDTVNKYYWCENDRFYYDIDVTTHEFYPVMTIASFWALTAGIASKEQGTQLVKRLCDPEALGGDVPLISLARNDADYHSDGRYWRGGLWLPTAYAALKGISDYGFHEQAQRAARKILDHMLTTYNEYEPHTVWECYSPESHSPATTASGNEICRSDFCGWSALGPISMFIEYVLGFCKINAFDSIVEWQRPDCFKGEIGIKNLKFGNVQTDIIAKGNFCRVISNAPYTLKINSRAYTISSGKTEFEIIR